MKGDRLIDGSYFMVSVGALAENFQAQIDFGEGAQTDGSAQGKKMSRSASTRDSRAIDSGWRAVHPPDLSGKAVGTAALQFIWNRSLRDGAQAAKAASGA